MAATKWTPQVIAAEVARKNAAGIERNYGTPVKPAPQLAVKPQSPIGLQKPANVAPQGAKPSTLPLRPGTNTTPTPLPMTPGTPVTAWGGVSSANSAPDSRYVDMAKNERFKVNNPNAGLMQGTYVNGGQHLSDDQLTGAGGILQIRGDAQKRIQDAIDAELAKGYGITDEFAKTNLAPLYKEIYNSEDRLGSEYGMTGMSDFGTFGGTVSRNSVQTPGVTSIDAKTKTSSPLAYGGNIMGFAPSTGNQNIGDVQTQLADLGQKWHNADPADRAAIHEQAMALGTAAGGTFDSKTGKWTFPTPQAGDYTGADVQAEIDAQIKGLTSQIDTLKSGAMFGVNQNNAFLDEQIGKLRTAKNQNDLTIQETENRFGGVYSGGMRLGQAANLTSTNEAIGGVTRDVAARNQQLIDQLGTQTSTIAANIADIQAKTPQIIRDRILEYQTKTAPLTGMFNGKPTMDAKDQDFRQGVTMAQLTGFLPNGQPTTDEQQRQLTNLWKVAAETGVIPNALADLYGIKRGTQTQDAYQFAQQQALAWDKFELDKANPGGGSGGDKPQTAQNMRTYFDSMVERDGDGKITNKTALEAAIMEAPISDYDAYQLALLYGIPWSGPIPQQGN